MYGCRCVGDTSASTVTVILEGTADVNMCDRAGKTSLMVAAEAGNHGAIMALLNSRADVAAAVGTDFSQDFLGLNRCTVDAFARRTSTTVLDKYIQRQRRQIREAEEMAEEELRTDPYMGSSPGGAVTEMHTVGLQNSLSEFNIPEESEGEVEEQLKSFEEETSSCRESRAHNIIYLSRVCPCRPKDLAKPSDEDKLARLSKPTSFQDIAGYSSGTGETAIVMAAREGHAEVCEELIQHGADPSYGTTALSAAAFGGHVEVCHMMVRSGPSTGDVFAAIKVAELRGHDLAARTLRGYEVFSAG